MYHIHKGIHTITALLSAAVLLLLTTVIAACAEADFLDGSQQLLPTDGLTIMPSAWEMKVPTRLDDYHDANWTNNDDTYESNIEADDVLKEGDIGEKLDVFIAGITTPSFWKEYHLTKGQPFAGATAKVEDNQLDVLATGNWFDSEGITAGQTYDVYVAVNTEATHPEGGVGSKDALLALTNTNTDVDKLYKAQSDLNNSIENRRMMMDGHTQWTPTTDLSQTINVQLNRAEAKAVAHITFDPAFYLTRQAEGYTIASPMWKYVNWDQKTRVFADADPLTLDELDLKSNSGRSYPTAEGVESSYDYYYTEAEGVKTYYSSIDVEEKGGHFYFYQPSDTPGEDPTQIEVHKATSDMAVEIPYIDIITYTYAFGWGNEPMKYAPYVLVSYGYTKNQSTSFNYYRIPLVDEATTHALRRNHIYRVSAVIAGNGSSSLEEYSNPVDLHYEVVDWTERESQHSKVNGDRLYFFNLEPTLYNVYGEGAGTTADPKYRTQVISYSAHSDAQVSLSNIEVYYNNNDGKKPIATITGGNNTTSVGNLATDGYHIEVNQATQQIIVQTSVLKNHAVKFIKFRAYTSDRSDWQTQGFYADVTVKHFPIDNIQSISGKWSSRWDGVDPTTSTTYYTYNVYTYYRKKYKRTVDDWVEINQTQWANGIGSSNEGRMNANSPETAVNGYYAIGNGGSVTRQSNSRNNTPVDDSGLTITWNGTNVTIKNGNRTFRSDLQMGGYDYVSSYYTTGNNYNGGNFRGHATLNKYSNYYHLESTTQNSYDPAGSNWPTNVNYDWEWEKCTQAQYEASSSGNRKYETEEVTTTYLPAGVTEYTSETITTTGTPSTGDWTDYEKKTGSLYFGINYDGEVVYYNYYNYYYGFRAKWFDDATSICRQLNENGYASNTSANVGTDDNGKNNNHMYVIQITATSTDYVLGRPTIDGNYQSKDHVVSPAFMIASQLGAVQSAAFNGSRAATHCGTYMEVATDGTRYTGWRLPTAEEVKVIIKYQGDPDVKRDGIMSEVLGGENYYTLDGNSQATGIGTGNDTYVRCVRDLSAEEVKKLNEGI